VVAPYWDRDVDAVVEKKLKDEKQYKELLREALVADPSLLNNARW
jgi:hypothetical protein